MPLCVAVQFQRTEGAVLATVVGLLGFPAAHIYANVVCLVAISAPAREGERLRSRAVQIRSSVYCTLASNGTFAGTGDLLYAHSIPVTCVEWAGLESIHLLLYRLLDGFLLLLIALFGCGLDSVDLQRDLGVQSGSNSALEDA